VSLNKTTSIKEENGAWTATDTMETPMGQVTDTTTLEKGTLALRKRSVHQGPGAININVTGNQATGSMTMNGQERPISVDLGGPLFADGAGGQQAIGSLPLAEGYTTTFRNLDVRKQKVKLLQLKVAGTEKVTVPAGTFDTYKVQITSAEGGPDNVTLWVDKDSRKPVKMSAVLAEMGGATMTAELAP
jgi:hypothetical protein